MLLIAAALEEELKIALSLCRNSKKIHGHCTGFWQAALGEKKISFLKTGVGPRRSAESLEMILNVINPSKVLVIGYAGALDPGLKLGDLVHVRRALACSLDEKRKVLEHIELDGTFELMNCESLIMAAKTAGLRVHAGDTLTSAYVIGDPAHKNLLHNKFQASIVDMETAALARVAQSSAIPLGCLRAVSDEFHDTFLTPFSYDPTTNAPGRAMKLIGKGAWIRTYRVWREHASVARGSLRRLLSYYMQTI